MNKIYPTLYSRTNTGAVQTWYATQNGNAYTTTYGQIDGKKTTTLPIYCEAKNVGKKNESTAIDQCTTEIEAIYKKNRKSNYFDSIDDIDKGWLEPQLAKPCKAYIDKVDWKVGQIVDHKLNGFACIIRKILGKVRAFTRTNEEYHSIPHILEELGPFFEENPNAYLQGELYNEQHVNELNKIAELIAVTRKEKDITPQILSDSKNIVQFHMYDGYGFEKVTVDANGTARRRALISMISKNKFKYVIPITYKVCYTFQEMKVYADAYISKGGEGAIIRNPLAKYQHKRTSNLLKYKKMEDAEFKVIEVCEGTGNWAGCAKFAWCELPNGKKEKKFKANIEGSQTHLREVFKNKDKYVGKWITVRYQELSPYGTPLIPYSNLVVRKEIEG